MIFRTDPILDSNSLVTVEYESLEAFAKALHEAGREAVAKNCVVRRDIPVKGFIEWNDMDEQAREGRRIQARFIQANYIVLKRIES